jgi:hypothetical protein
MKKLLFALLLSLTSLLAVAQDNEIAIKKVLNSETKAFFDRDAKKMVSYWHITPQTSMYIILSPKFIINYNADSLKNYQLTGQPTKMDLDQIGSIRTNWIFCITGKNAYVTFDANLGNAQEKQYTHETRFMEKIDGDWKIVSSNVVFIDNKK